MKYILKAYNIWELGQRANQEDSIYPEYGKATDSDRLFILCDGMGGHSSGEVASQTVCSSMSSSVLNNCPDSEGSFSDEDLKIALDDAFNALDAKDNGAVKKMGTTLTFLKLHSDGCTIAHIGDSRVYHIRPGKEAADTEILFQTVDHSLVNDLIKIGELTPEEAKFSKQKNVITRAMQPCMERRPKADVYHSTDIRPGDYFMLCSDGILEQMEDENIRYIFSEKGGDASKKIEMLIKVTEENHDNHSAILVHIVDVVGAVNIEKKDEEEVGTPTSYPKKDTLDRNSVKKYPNISRSTKNVKQYMLYVVLAFLLLLLGGYHLYSKKGKSPSKEKTEKTVEHDKEEKTPVSAPIKQSSNNRELDKPATEQTDADNTGENVVTPEQQPVVDSQLQQTDIVKNETSNRPSSLFNNIPQPSKDADKDVVDSDQQKLQNVVNNIQDDTKE